MINQGLVWQDKVSMCTRWSRENREKRRQLPKAVAVVTPKAVAVVIGNAKYDGNYTTLPSCHKDAEEMAAALQSGQFPGRATTKHLDSTREEIFCAIDWLGQAVQNGATFTWFHFSGHGVWDLDRLHIVPSDSKRKEDNIPVDSIAEALQKHVSRECFHVITLDCCQIPIVCHTTTSSSSSSCSRGGCKHGGYALLARRKLNHLSLSPPGHEIFIFHACEKHCAVFESSPFSGALARWLQEKNLTIGRLASKVTTEVLKETGHEQRPNCQHTIPRNPDYIVTGKGPLTQKNEILCQTVQKALEKIADLINPSQSLQQACSCFLIVCDGIIGCGKTTFLDKISTCPNWPRDIVEIFREPVARSCTKSWWRLLVEFYNALNTSGSVEAVIRLEDTIWDHHRAIATNRKKHAITERCCASAVHVFCAILLENGILPECSTAAESFPWVEK